MEETGSERELTARLRARGAEPSSKFVSSLAHEIRHAPRRGRVYRSGLALAFVVVVLIPFAAFGGLGYAAATVRSVATAVVSVTSSKPAHTPAANAPAATPAAAVTPVAPPTPAASQYSNGKACGQADGGPKKPNQTPCPPEAGPKK